jgi:AraC-like DNA-binding protein
VVDVLSDVLRSVRLVGALFFEANFTAPWCVTAQIRVEHCQPYLAGLVQVIGFHVVLEGAMLVTIEGEPPLRLRAGQMVLFPRYDVHMLASATGLVPVSVAELMQLSADGMWRIDHGGGREPTNVICGFLGTQDAFNPLLSALPRLLTLDIHEAGSRDWIEASVRFAARQLAAGQLPSAGIISRLSEALLVEAVRDYASKAGGPEDGWLKGLNDPHIGRSLALMHSDLAADWPPDVLAREAALSRSAFMERFVRIVGMPPGRYLTVWRLNVAKSHLRETRMSVAQVAFAVGYESEEGFRRAFKREFSMWPAEWRDHHGASSGPPKTGGPA